jgi:FeS assembly protein IscX
MSNNPPPLKWTDVDDIGYALWELNSKQNPLQVSFPALRDLVVALPAFEGAPDGCNEKILEAIQMSWLEEFQDQD